MERPRILCLRLDHLHACIEVRDGDPIPAGAPLLLVRGSYQAGKVAAVNAPAAAAGVALGTPWRRAARRLPDAVVRPFRPERYRPYLEAVGEILREQTPWVEPLPGSEEEWFADLGPGTLPAGEAEARATLGRIRVRLGLEGRTGLACGKLPARAAAWSAGEPPEGRTVAAVPPGAERRVLAPMPLELFWDLRGEQIEQLHRLGVRTIGDLAALPRRALIPLFGAAAVQIHRISQGWDPRRVRRLSPERTLDESESVEPPLRDRSRLAAVVHLLAERMSQRLARDGRFVRYLRLDLRLEGGDALSFPRALKEAECRPAALAGAVLSLPPEWIAGPIEGDETPPGIEWVGLRGGGLVDAGQSQLGLFGDCERAALLEGALRRLEERYGSPVAAPLSRLDVEPAGPAGARGWAGR